MTPPAMVVAPRVSLVIPAYNEEHRLGPFLESVSRFVQGHPGILDELIVVNDGSRDGTSAVVAGFEGRIPALRRLDHSTNLGKGAAVRTGVLAARGELVLFMDADGATPAEEIPRMIERLSDFDLVVGHRWMPGAQTERRSPLRRLSGWIYRRYMACFGLGDIDTMCGFKGFRRSAARSLFEALGETGWLFDTEICYRALHSGFRIDNLPIRWTSQDGSKLSGGTLVLSAARILPLILRIRKEISGAKP